MDYQGYLKLARNRRAETNLKLSIFSSTTTSDYQTRSTLQQFRRLLNAYKGSIWSRRTFKAEITALLNNPKTTLDEILVQLKALGESKRVKPNGTFQHLLAASYRLLLDNELPEQARLLGNLRVSILPAFSLRDAIPLKVLIWETDKTLPTQKYQIYMLRGKLAGMLVPQKMAAILKAYELGGFTPLGINTRTRVKKVSALRRILERSGVEEEAVRGLAELAAGANNRGDFKAAVAAIYRFLSPMLRSLLCDVTVELDEKVQTLKDHFPDLKVEAYVMKDPLTEEQQQEKTRLRISHLTAEAKQGSQPDQYLTAIEVLLEESHHDHSEALYLRALELSSAIFSNPGSADLDPGVVRKLMNLIALRTPGPNDKERSHIYQLGTGDDAPVSQAPYGMGNSG